VRQRDLQRIAQLERNGTMQRRRDQLRAWFQAHPQATPEDAIRELRYSHPDYSTSLPTRSGTTSPELAEAVP